MAELLECRVCLDIMTAFKQKRDGKTDFEYELGRLCDVINMPCPHSDSIWELWKGAKMHHRWFRNSRRWIDERPEEVSLEGWSAKISYDDFMGLLMHFHHDGESSALEVIDLVSKEVAEHPGTARILKSQWIDSSIPKSWYAACLDEHGGDCQEPAWMKAHSETTTAHPDWLVDVVDQCVVPFTSQTANYVTLSYTWGRVQCLMNTTDTLERLKEAGSLQSLQAPTIPQTVRDAMGITRHLGERYLWVDSLCIVQDDVVASYRNLNAMHQIYAKSTLCLVAYAGTDANYGLRGINGITTPRAVNQSILDIAGGEQLSRLERGIDDPDVPDGESLDDGSEYRQRGWTYQEFMFAKRRLIFTEGLLRWDCANVRWGEERWNELKQDLWTRKMPYTPLMKNRFPSFITLQDFISGYNTRYFTYQNDAFGAFLGIQNHLNGIFHGGLNYGHPEMFFDISLLWSPERGVNGLRRVASNSMSPDADNLPSWSWMSYMGDSDLPNDGEYDFHENLPDGFTESVAEWFAMKSPVSSPSNMRPISCEWYRYQTLFKDDHASQVPGGWGREMTSTGSPKYRRLSQTWEGAPRSKYPIPVPILAEAVRPIEQLPFLFANTTRCKFVTRQFDLPRIYQTELASKNVVELCSTSGEFAGFLVLDNGENMTSFYKFGTVELVAAVKGWTTSLCGLQLAIKKQENLAPMQRRPARFPEGDNWHKELKRTRDRCYFVLCIQWENGVAKRQASGKVFADVWERNQEPVDLILG